MKKIYYLAAAFVALSFAGCGDGIDLPDVNVEKDLNMIPLPEDQLDLVQVESKDASVSMEHIGGLHTDADFDFVREKVKAGESPWAEAYEQLKSSKYAQLDWTTWPTEIIIRGEGAENYMNAARGAAAAYQMGLRWKIEQDDRYADKAVSILNQWADVCKGLGGNSNVSLASGIYGHEFAIAGELLYDYIGWDSQDRQDYVDWMLTVFYPANKDFLVRHHGTNHLHYWANWGLCNIASTMAIGILADRRDIYNEAIEHFQTGVTNGRLTRAIYHAFTGQYANFAQLQESGRDQGHTLMCVGLIGVICQLAWNQGDDFFAYKQNLFLKACEYAACYNYTSDPVPYTTYTWQQHNAWGGISPVVQSALGENGRGNDRPIWALPYYHYKAQGSIKDEQIKYTKNAVETRGIEGGGGNYGETSGGFDVLGFGTLMYTQ
ncbi:alginate lyase family protein [Bacteroides congonensis]|uniref:alginate lyase family protein n=1 Tax=Bacteroides congonensis TaxID=1871006 RepID=UPI002FDAC5D5